jgi:hypothetical protein
VNHMSHSPEQSFQQSSMPKITIFVIHHRFWYDKICKLSTVTSPRITHNDIDSSFKCFSFAYRCSDNGVDAVYLFCREGSATVLQYFHRRLSSDGILAARSAGWWAGVIKRENARKTTWVNSTKVFYRSRCLKIPVVNCTIHFRHAGDIVVIFDRQQQIYR